MVPQKHPQLSPRDWELLSAYLDRQLNPRQQRRLEARLDIEPKLQAGLEEIRQTRLLIKAAPQLKAPRSFRLTPEMLPQSAGRSRFFPVLQFSSAIASLIFVLVVMGDIFGIGRRLAPGGELAAPQIITVSENDMVVLEAEDLEMAEEMEVPEAMVVDDDAKEISGETEEMAAPQLFSAEAGGEEVATEKAPPEAAPEVLVAESSNAATSEEGAADVMPAAEPVDRSEVPAEAAEAPKSVADSIVEDVPEPQPGDEPKVLEEQPVLPQDAPVESNHLLEVKPENKTNTWASWKFPLIRWIEIGTGVVAVATGLGAYWLRRRN